MCATVDAMALSPVNGGRKIQSAPSQLRGRRLMVLLSWGARTGKMSENSMASSKPDALWAEPVWGVGNLLYYTDLMKV